MKYRILLPALISAFLISCSDSGLIKDAVRYNEESFKQVEVTNDVVYGNNNTLFGLNVDLKMDIYEPKGDPEAARPLLILAHGGGFTQGDKADVAEMASYFAKSGYVVASIQYRLIDWVPTIPQIKEAILNTVFDAKAAVRWFRKDAANGNQYRIDGDRIFMGGVSAGGFIALHYAYVRTDAELAEIGGQELVDYANNNGGLEGNSGNDGYSSELKAILNISGALVKASFVDAGEPPLYSVHGTADLVVPYLQGESNGTGVTTEGSGLIHPEATAAGVTNQLRTIQDEGHSAFFSCADCLDEMRTFLYGLL